MEKHRIYCHNINNQYINSHILYLMKQEDITELIINSDVEADYESFTLSGTMICSNKYLYPVGAGFDIGCGLGVFKTDTTLNKDKISALFSKKTPFGIRRRSYRLLLMESDLPVEIREELYTEQLGEIERGNHFIEIRTCENDVYIVIHSGVSQNMKLYFQRRILNLFKDYQAEGFDSDNAYLLKISKDHEEVKRYIKETQAANTFAADNRKYIAKKVAAKLGGKIIDSFDSSHEYIKREGDDIIHCNGTQEFKEKGGVLSALILSGATENNYIVEKIGGNDYINHGTAMTKIDENGVRSYSSFEELMKAEQLKNVRPICRLIPVCGCKKEANGYEYKLL